MGKVIGIDLGTTNSCVAVVVGGQPVVIPNAEGSATTPSVVAFNANQRLVGSVAKRQMVSNPENTLYSIKRLIGRKFDSPEVTESRRLLGYPIAPSLNQDVSVTIFGRQYALPEIQAEILASMRKTAEDYLGDRVSEAVITVPAYFNDAQRQATKDSGFIAGLKVLRIINEPTAAALAYGLGRTTGERIAVYDLGGGTFDVSILEIGEGVFQVRATGGDTFLGGDDFDRRIAELMLERFKQKEGLDLSIDRVALQRIKDAAQEAKHVLSRETRTTINLPFIAITASGPKHLQMTLTREELEALVADLVTRTIDACRQALAHGKLRREDVQEVVLVGGQTRMPMVRAAVRDFFGREPHLEVNPDEVVAVGAAIQGAVLQGELGEVLLLDVTPLTLGLETKGNVFTPFIERNTTIPTRKTMTFTTTDDNQSSVTVHVLQGERQMASDNISLAKFELVDIPTAPKGFPKIEVTFDIDANGLLSVSARDLGTGRSQAVRITPSGGLSPAQIEEILKEAETSRADDIRKGDLAALKNDAESAIYAAENLAKKYGQHLSADKKAICLQLIHKVRDALFTDNPVLIEKSLADLRQFTHSVLNSMI